MFYNPNLNRMEVESQLKTLKEKVSSQEKEELKPRFLFRLYDSLEVKLASTRLIPY
mgnify:FL=1